MLSVIVRPSEPSTSPAGIVSRKLSVRAIRSWSSGHAGLDVLELRRLATGETGHAVLGEVAAQLHLPGEREHVRCQPVGQEHGRVDLALGALVHRLVDDGGEGGEPLAEQWCGGLVHGQGH